VIADFEGDAILLGPVWNNAMMTSLFHGPPSTMRGMAFMVLSTILLVGMNAIVRKLSQGMHPFEIAFFRVFVGFLFFSPVFLRSGLKHLKTTCLGLHATRGILNGAAMLTYFLGISLVPLAKVIAITFTAPLFATAIGFFVLREFIRARRITALAAGFIGALIVLRPEMVEIDAGPILLLFAAAVWGGVLIVIKVLSRTESSLTITLYSTIFLMPITVVAALPYWQTPTLEQAPWLVGIGVVGSLGQWCMAQAFKEADVTAVLPLEFTKLIWAAFLGYVMFTEIPDIWTWIGGAVIFVSSTYIAFRERQAEAKGGGNRAQK